MNIVFGIAGWSGSGKTELVTNLIKFITKKYKFKICAIKHAHDNFNIDHKGKDTYRFFSSGANQIIISSKSKMAKIEKVDDEKSLTELLSKAKNADIVLVEGWKSSKIKKIEVYRKEIKKPLLHESDHSYVAVATDEKNFLPKRNIKVLDLNDVSSIADYILNYST